MPHYIDLTKLFKLETTLSPKKFFIVNRLRLKVRWRHNGWELSCGDVLFNNVLRCELLSFLNAYFGRKFIVRRFRQL